MSNQATTKLITLHQPPAEGHSCRVELDNDSSAMVVAHNGKSYGYLNRCPHTGAPLDWKPGQFLSHDGAYIQCSLHGALFRIESGQCLRGPCVGEALQAIDVVISNDSNRDANNPEHA